MIKEWGAKIYAYWSYSKNKKWINKPIVTQQKLLKKIVSKAKNTCFCKDHNFEKIIDLKSFQNCIPIRDYEGLRPYIDRVLGGEANILWPGRPLYYAKTSGTTSGVKYIPITKCSMPQHIRAAREAILNYIYETGKTNSVNGKHIFIQGSPVLKDKKGVALGRLSGIVAHYIPNYLQKNRMPSWKTNCIEDWETKIDAIVEETYKENMTIIGGIPSWVQMYFERLTRKTNKNIGNLFPNFSLFIYGGVNFEPYRNIFKNLIGHIPDTIEFYPASEGFFAYQNKQKDNGLLLLLDHGIYYEFIVADTFFDKKQTIHSLTEVNKGINYVMLISSNSGLWRYNIGDTIKFTSIDPYKIIVTGRIKHFISTFGEHVIVNEVEQSLKEAIDQENSNIRVKEFTVAPEISPEIGLPYHEWFIEFDNPPIDIIGFSEKINRALQNKNIYYNDLIEGKILRSLVISEVKKNGFNNYMKSIGKLGGQNKIPRLSDNRKIANILKEFTIQR